MSKTGVAVLGIFVVDLAFRAGAPRRLFQDHRYRWHYDLTPDLRAAAVRLGAREVSTREIIRRMRLRLPTDPAG